MAQEDRLGKPLYSDGSGSKIGRSSYDVATDRAATNAAMHERRANRMMERQLKRASRKGDIRAIAELQKLQDKPGFKSQTGIQNSLQMKELDAKTAQDQKAKGMQIAGGALAPGDNGAANEVEKQANRSLGNGSGDSPANAAASSNGGQWVSVGQGATGGATTPSGKTAASKTTTTATPADSREIFEKDLGNSPLIRNGDKGALNRAYARADALKIPREEVQKFLGAESVDWTSNAPSKMDTELIPMKLQEDAGGITEQKRTDVQNRFSELTSQAKYRDFTKEVLSQPDKQTGADLLAPPKKQPVAINPTKPTSEKKPTQQQSMSPTASVSFPERPWYDKRADELIKTPDFLKGTIVGNVIDFVHDAAAKGSARKDAKTEKSMEPQASIQKLDQVARNSQTHSEIQSLFA